MEPSSRLEGHGAGRSVHGAFFVCPVDKVVDKAMSHGTSHMMGYGNEGDDAHLLPFERNWQLSEAKRLDHFRG